jgi:hypothetical protein
MGPDGMSPVMLVPGGSATMSVSASTRCAGQATTYDDLSVYSGQTQVPVPGLTLTSSCAIDLGPWYVSTDPGPMDPLSASIDVSSVVNRGRDLSYVVVLVNPTAAAIALNPLPVFHQSLGDNGGRYRLHAPFTLLPAGSWVRLRMQIPVPANTPLGTTTLSWSLESGSTQVAQATATVTVR